MKAKFAICMIASVYAAANGEACTADSDCTAAAGKTACCGYVSKKDSADTRTCWEDKETTANYGTTVTAGWNSTTMRYGCTSYGNSGINLKAGVMSLVTGIATHALLA